MPDISEYVSQAEYGVKHIVKLAARQGHAAADVLLLIIYAAGIEAEACGIDLQAADTDLRARLDQAASDARCQAVRHAQRLLDAEDQARQGLPQS